ncbi:LOW QUALITY PROTEIN: hypothetical protein BC936DRAFT_144500 [Jimgerdemannia flammicorona]|uniref:Uncharacterized protein n=1 Tax=Jimgerdemannia flammicorona TaxID=994334 RepID=A0A433DCA5_9FUNG|nr:LOW QUALITY PROTEIN: hypothetical protein BC936DRAFT_144500 [Jimgerdemannia flammicorona]
MTNVSDEYEFYERMASVQRTALRPPIRDDCQVICPPIKPVSRFLSSWRSVVFFTKRRYPVQILIDIFGGLTCRVHEYLFFDIVYNHSSLQ